MRPMAKMSGSIFEIKREQLSEKMQRMADLIDSYEVGKQLLGEDKKITQTFCQQDIMKYTVQTIIGTDYRVNQHPDSSIEFVFSKRLLNYDNVISFKETIDKLELNSNMNYKKQDSYFNVKCIVNFGKELTDEKVIELFMALNIE